MIRDIAVASINKGQFPLATFAAIILSLIWRMPEGDISRLVFEILDGVKRWYLAGYILFVLSLGGWYTHAKAQRRDFHEEMARIADERNALQQKQIGQIGSSDRR